MSKSRRRFLTRAALGIPVALAACHSKKEGVADLPPGAPSAFGTSPEVGPEVSSSTFSEAEKLVQVRLSDADRRVAADSWRKTLAPVYERRVGPRKVALAPELSPWSRWDPVWPGQEAGPDGDRFIRTKADP